MISRRELRPVPPKPRERVIEGPKGNHGTLQLQPSGRWAVFRPGRRPVEIMSDELFRVEVGGELKLTRMEFRHFTGPLKGREYRGQPGEYYSADGYHLANGLRAALGTHD